MLASEPDATLGRMKVFISSPIERVEPETRGAGQVRSATKVKRSEDVGANAHP
jgi:hypothetical protein